MAAPEVPWWVATENRAGRARSERPYRIEPRVPEDGRVDRVLVRARGSSRDDRT
jgi:hypothetical protein